MRKPRSPAPETQPPADPDDMRVRTLRKGRAPKRLTDMQHLFVTGCKNGLSAVDAYKQAGFAANGKPTTIASNAANMRKLPLIAEALEAHEAEMEAARKAATERACVDAGVTRERVVNELAAIGFSDIREVVKWAGKEATLTVADADSLPVNVAAAIAEIRKTKDGTLIIKLHNKLGALHELSDILKLKDNPLGERGGTFNFVVKGFERG